MCMYVLIINNNYTCVKTTKIILHLIEEDYNTNNTPDHILFGHQGHVCPACFWPYSYHVCGIDV